jgi:hypothetical protein
MFRRGLLTAGALVAVALAGSLVTRWPDEGPSVGAAVNSAAASPFSQVTVDQPTPSMAAAVGRTNADVDGAAMRREVAGRRGPKPAALSTSAIVLPPGQLEGVRQLARAAASGQLRVAPSLVDWSPGGHLEVAVLTPPDLIHVPALEIEPLAN